MKKLKASSLLTSLIMGTMIISYTNISHAQPSPQNTPTIEKKEKQPLESGQKNGKTPFSWDKPGHSSPVLHPGTAQAAGMWQHPLNEMDPAINDAIASNVMPGAVVLIARRGTIVKEKAYGYAARYTDDQFTEMGNPIKMQKDTIFDLASISKLFTVTAAMQLYEKGEFKLDDPVAKYIPEFAQNGKEAVTIRQLMTHTSGFTAWIPLYQMGTDRKDRLQIVFAQPLKNAPGTHYEYSDLNMITLGALVERLTGKRLDQYVKAHITGPLGMSDTMYNPPASLKNRIAATEYQPWTNRGLVWGQVHDENAWSLDGVAGHAGVFTTAHDLAVFAQTLLNGGKYKEARILQPETVKLIEENQLPQFPGDSHGLGWELNQGWYMDALSENSTLGHTGYTGTSIVVSPNNKTIAILLTNRVHPTRNTVSTNGIRRTIAQLTADAIPVDIPGKGEAWFSGYGNRLNRTLEAEIDVPKGADLSFDTWFRTEEGYDVGRIEVSTDGADWTSLDEFTGSSGQWISKTMTLPLDTHYIRFVYDTDGSVNGRGWYIHNITLTMPDGQIITPDFESDQWVKRNH